MVVREISLKELDDAFKMVQHLYKELSYDEFEDLIYEMKESYVMIGAFEKEKIMGYMGVSVLTTLKNKRHIRVYDFYATSSYAERELLLYLKSYKQSAMAKEVIFEEE